VTEPLVGIVGAKALRRDINRMTTDVRSPLYAALRQAGRRAVEPIAEAVRSALPRSDRPAGRRHRPGALAGTVRASGTRSGGAVRMGSKAVPYAGWVEFGGRRRRPHFSERPYVKSGRYLFPAARGLEARAAADYSKALNDVFASSGVWTNTTASPQAVRD
jgi:hypothetical protein